MPDGSSSAAPVTSPGPRSAKNRRKSRRLEGAELTRNADRMFLQPADDFFRVFVGRKDRIEDVLDATVADDHCETLHERHALDRESRQAHRFGEGELLVAQHLE